MDMLSEFKNMWSGCFGKVDTTKHRMEMKSDGRPIYQEPYRAGPIAREKEKKEIDRMLRAGVIEPTSPGRASDVVFVPKKDGIILAYAPRTETRARVARQGRRRAHAQRNRSHVSCIAARTHQGQGK